MLADSASTVDAMWSLYVWRPQAKDRSRLMLRSGMRIACSQATWSDDVMLGPGVRRFSSRSAGSLLIVSRHSLLQHAVSCIRTMFAC